MGDWTSPFKQAFAELRRRRMFRVIAVFLVVGWLLIQVVRRDLRPARIAGLGAETGDRAGGAELRARLRAGLDLRPHRRAASNAPARSTRPPDAAAPLPPRPSLGRDPAVRRPQRSQRPGLFLRRPGRGDPQRARARSAACGWRRAPRRSASATAPPTPRDIGRALNVAAIMEGSVRKAGERVRVTAQLIDAGNGYHLWSENFDRGLEDIFAIQEEIARSVVARAARVAEDAGSARPASATRRATCAPTSSTCAAASCRRMKRPDHVAARAADVPARDRARSRLRAGACRPCRSLVELLLWRLARPEDVLDEALAASQRALELAPELAEAHVAHAHTLRLAGEHDAADRGSSSARSRSIRTCTRRTTTLPATASRVASTRARSSCSRRRIARGPTSSRHWRWRWRRREPGRPARAPTTSRAARSRPACAEIEVDPENGRAHYSAPRCMQLHLGDTRGRRAATSRRPCACARTISARSTTAPASTRGPASRSARWTCSIARSPPARVSATGSSTTPTWTACAGCRASRRSWRASNSAAGQRLRRYHRLTSRTGCVPMPMEPIDVRHHPATRLRRPRPQARPPARDGHRQRHPGFVFRRRRARDRSKPRSRTACGWRRRAPTCSMSAANPRVRARDDVSAGGRAAPGDPGDRAAGAARPRCRSASTPPSPK